MEKRCGNINVLTQTMANKLRVTQRKMEKSMIALKDKITNEELPRRTTLVDVFERISRLNWSWAGHISGMKDGKWTCKLM